MRNKVVYSVTPHFLFVVAQDTVTFIFLSAHICFSNYVYQKDIQMGKIDPDTEWSTQMLGTLQKCFKLGWLFNA